MAEILPQRIRQTFPVLPGCLEQNCPTAGMGMWLRQTEFNFFRKPCGVMLCGQVRMEQVILTGMV